VRRSSPTDAAFTVPAVALFMVSAEQFTEYPSYVPHLSDHMLPFAGTAHVVPEYGEVTEIVPV